MLAAHGAGRAPLRQSNSQQTQPIHFGAAKDFPDFVYPSKRFRDCQCGRPFGSMQESLSEGKVRAEVVDAAESRFARKNCRGRYARGGGAVPARWRCRSFGHSPSCLHAVESTEVRENRHSKNVRVYSDSGAPWIALGWPLPSLRMSADLPPVFGPVITKLPGFSVSLQRSK